MNDRRPLRTTAIPFARLFDDVAAQRRGSLLPMPPTLMGDHHGDRARRPAPKTGAVTRFKVEPPLPYSGPQYEKRMLGSLSRTWEVGPRGGPGTISSGMTTGGRPDAGGRSYGSWQMATNAGMPQAFLRSEGGRWASQFHGLQPGTPGFDTVWKRIAAADPAGFENAQRAFILRTNYGPALNAASGATGVDLSRGSGILQDMLWSTSVQHPWQDRNKIIQAALSRVKMPPNAAGFDEAFARELYAERARYWPDTKGRYRDEQAAAIRRAREEGDLKTPAASLLPVPRLKPRY